jgi:hypothetical protein
VSGPHPWGVLHLLVADDALPGGLGGTYMTICGELMPASELPPSSCPEDCECDVLYCSECVRLPNGPLRPSGPTTRREPSGEIKQMEASPTSGHWRLHDESQRQPAKLCEEFSWRYLPPAVYAEPEPSQDRSGLVGGEITAVEPRHRGPRFLV